MDTIIKNKGKARFDTRLPKDQKEFFEYAAALGGYRTLTEFVIQAVQEKSELIVEDHNRILASEKDQQVFFESMMNPKHPNEALKDAAERYKKTLTN